MNKNKCMSECKSKSKNLVNLNVNPCKMCMPMGAVSALMGIKGCMTILHGSQGCATYVRRHMATHYNEPIDIASSSLTEEGTVFGGEANLLKGLRNMIELYAPEVIGVCTTCLAETIGEDVGAIVKKFYEMNPDMGDVKIINVASPGYGGTQNEGWFVAVRAVLKSFYEDRGVPPVTPPPKTDNAKTHMQNPLCGTGGNNYCITSTSKQKINIITPMISPADTRWLKGFLGEMGIDFVLLPDLSDNLDGATEARYNRLKTGGTSIEDVATMGGAKLTIEFSEFTDEKISPAEYLNDVCNIPYIKLPLPVGIRGMDKLIKTLVEAGGVVTDNIRKARGRYVDAMVDSHKHCAEVRAAVCGDPDFVAAMVRLCCENGMLPVIAATGSVSSKMREMLTDEIKECREYHFADDIRILDDSDYATVENACRELGANLLIGSSDARRIARKLNIPLIRCAFPIHDHVGGQRVRVLGFDGALNIIDQAANAMMEKVENNFREELYKRFYKDNSALTKNGTLPSVTQAIQSNRDLGERNNVMGDGVTEHSKGLYDPKVFLETTLSKTASHPCFGEHACKNARVHLPVAPGCNIQCNYCLRDYDCMNESRPGVSSKILTPTEALERYVKLKESMPNLTVVGIAGPGDALANFEASRETLRLIRERDPDITFCIATNGLLLPQYVHELKVLGVSHVTVTVNAVDPAIGAKIYKHVTYMGQTFTGVEGASILLANQLSGIKMLADAGIMCKVNCVTLKGINEDHLYEVTKTISKLGVFMTNIMPHIPVKGSAFENLDRMTNKEIAAIRERCGVNVKQMMHCRQCRSDAAGTLDEDVSIELREAAAPAAPVDKNLKRFAVATKTGSIVDTHFGHASEFYIYESNATDTRFVETRKVSKYCLGPADCGDRAEKEDRWDSVIRAVSDCEAVLALRIGPTPEKRLRENGIGVITTYDRVETAVANAAREGGIS